MTSYSYCDDQEHRDYRVVRDALIDLVTAL